MKVHASRVLLNSLLSNFAFEILLLLGFGFESLWFFIFILYFYLFGCVRLLLGGFEEGLHSFEFRKYFIVRTFVYQFLIINWCNFLLLRYLLTYLEGLLLLDNFTFDGHLGALDNGRFLSLADGL